jgi:hypothetical protein
MSKPYEARISTGILKTAFYRQSNESSNAVFGLSKEGATNSNQIRLKTSVPNAGHIARSVNKTEIQTHPLVSTALRDNTINAVTGSISGDITVDNTSFYADNSIEPIKAAVVFSGSQRPLHSELNSSAEQNAEYTDFILNKDDYINRNLITTTRWKLQQFQYTSDSESTEILYPNTDTCPRQSPYPDPGLTGITYIYDDQQGWIPYP